MTPLIITPVPRLDEDIYEYTFLLTLTGFV